ncbi:hypothetical protein N9242_04920 [Vicingaceae bacterium]|nr:hypothetical protein [Vicingaceae bacterium]
MTQAERLLSVFIGAKSAHGTTTVGRIGRNGKAESKSMIIRSPLTVDLVQDHIDGKQGVGAIPINEENVCKFAALDIDVYDLNHNELQAKIQKLKLPLMHCRSKSGGAHLYLFLKDWVPAANIRDYLTEMSIALGFSGCEIFPKQDTIIAERGDVGNFINMPYFNAEMPQRYAFNAKCEALELDEFLDAVEEIRVTESELEGLRFSGKRKYFTDGPPCLEHLFADGPIDTPRNTCMYQCGIYAKLSEPDNWKSKLEEFNRTLCTEPLPSHEVINLGKSLDKKDWAYKCKEEPFKSYCDPTLCASRKHGIGNESPDMPSVGGLTIMLSEPRVYFMDVDGSRIQISTEQLQNQVLWQRACMEQMNIMPPTVKPQKWQQMINQLMQDATVLEVPEEATVKGQFKEHLKAYCTSHIRAMAPEEMEMNKPWTDDGVTKFKLEGLIEYLHHRRFKVDNRGHLIQMIRDMGGDNTKVNIHKSDGRRTTLRCWQIPAFEQEEIELSVREMNNDIPF